MEKRNVIHVASFIRLIASFFIETRKIKAAIAINVNHA
jgi:hypothetical protein